MVAWGSLRDKRWIVSGCLQIFPKNSERQDRVSYRRISQAGMKDLPGFFIAVQLHIEQRFGGEVTTEKVDVLRRDLNEYGLA